jgi:hypothetical protein
MRVAAVDAGGPCDLRHARRRSNTASNRPVFALAPVPAGFAAEQRPDSEHATVSRPAEQRPGSGQRRRLQTERLLGVPAAARPE